MKAQQTINSGRTVLGIELGSTRIKAVLIGKDYAPIASGSHERENRHKSGYLSLSVDIKEMREGIAQTLHNIQDKSKT